MEGGLQGHAGQCNLRHQYTGSTVCQITADAVLAGRSVHEDRMMLMKASAHSLTEQLAGRFSERIRTRLLAPGARLPSVRQCAEQHGVSPSTVVAAYDQLLAQGLVEARKNRGFFVRETAQPADEARAATPAMPKGWNAAHWIISRRSPAPVNATSL